MGLGGWSDGEVAGKGARQRALRACSPRSYIPRRHSRPPPPSCNLPNHSFPPAPPRLPHPAAPLPQSHRKAHLRNLLLQLGICRRRPLHRLPLHRPLQLGRHRRAHHLLLHPPQLPRPPRLLGLRLRSSTSRSLRLTRLPRHSRVLRFAALLSAFSRHSRRSRRCLLRPPCRRPDLGSPRRCRRGSLPLPARVIASCRRRGCRDAIRRHAIYCLATGLGGAQGRRLGRQDDDARAFGLAAAVRVAAGAPASRPAGARASGSPLVAAAARRLAAAPAVPAATPAAAAAVSAVTTLAAVPAVASTLAAVAAPATPVSSA